MAVAKEYDATAIGHLNTLKAVIERLGRYFSENCQENLNKITRSKLELTASEKSFLIGLKTDIESLISMLEGLRNISFFSLRDVEEVADKLNVLKIDLGMTEKLDSTDTRSVTDPINAQIDNLIKEVGNLKGIINKHKSRIKKAIKENQDSINGFLQSAGYKYSVEIISDGESYKMKLLHKDLTAHIDSASKHLSYGEKNAFALVLFMHQVLSENPDLIVLDDPISSFDKDKKFAILYELFRGKASLRDRTTLMLTHDIEPAIDVIKSTADVFKGSNPSATFLLSRGGVVTEVPIKADDIHTFAKICIEIVSVPGDPLIKAIYMRRFYEIMENMGLEYNLLASLFKKRSIPTIQSVLDKREMTSDERSRAEASIKSRIPEFDYDSMLSVVKDDDAMRAKFFSTNIGYEKIQLFGIVRGKHDDHVISKFINESYHIENEYMMQLNPYKFESVPEYVVDECTRLINTE